MQIDITIDRADKQSGRNYLTWAPTRATLTRTDPGGRALSAVTVRLANSADTGGQLVFGTNRQNMERTPTLDLKLDPGATVEFWVAGGTASIDDLDAGLSVAEPDKPVLASKSVMVRIRKDANTLTPAEQVRFTTAFAQVNDEGNGLFQNFREMHRERSALRQAHGFSGFLAWHRAYLLDLERELQKKNPAVTLPYWRFDRPAPNVFTEQFMGRQGAARNVVFDPNNLLSNWQTDGEPGIWREPQFAADQPAFVSGEATTLALGGPAPGAFFDNGGVTTQQADTLRGFRRMEGDPHGAAHSSFDGWLSATNTAPRDPMFFLLHSNVDRLWARWQRLNDRFDGTQIRTYFFRGTARSNPATQIGHNLLDTMWPWNGITQAQDPSRPPNAPRGAFVPVPAAAWPAQAAKPTVGDMIDYHGLLSPGSDMNFGYDDVPYGVAT
ncbi:tyrosinase family protein [Pseudonocardia endophytica]|uniref:Tyrosinase n=1 Tax=Pseudonocardia endophytica TaxID=401976 RepID=A0A4V2PI10_PSEEN|nr:tyrosinase family protein [Pseudonocardia endophytica]TCK22796.1 tyrosinase [Pseudonocardia endophytica]